jgi:RNA polymerase sigma-70 factor, ECF subfamily
MEPEADVQSAALAVSRLGPPTGLATGDALTAEAYDRHAPEIHGLLVRVLRDADAAADLLADTFTRLLLEERAARWPSHPRAWLFRVASNLAVSRGRRRLVAQRVQRVLEVRERGRVEDSPEAEVLRRERSTDLHRALVKLSPDARAGLLLAAQGFDGATIASMLGRSETATRTLLCRARMRLRDELRETGP